MELLALSPSRMPAFLEIHQSEWRVCVWSCCGSGRTLRTRVRSAPGAAAGCAHRRPTSPPGPIAKASIPARDAAPRRARVSRAPGPPQPNLEGGSRSDSAERAAGRAGLGAL